MNGSKAPVTLITAPGAAGRAGALARDVVEGFARDPRELPPRYFYDDAGSALYEQITRLDEYYLTRAEESILLAEAAEIARQSGARELLELGPGSARKALVLAQAMNERAGFEAYLPVDCCEPSLRSCASDIRAAFPRARIHGVCGEFDDIALAPPPANRRLAAFLGSTIGNLDETPAVELLRRLRACAGPDGFVLLGTDLKPSAAKSKERLELAYDDAAGVTAAFNANVLAVMNRELGADFRLEDFRHRAPYVEAASRIEMHLVARRPVTVRMPAICREYAFAEGQILRTEISCKYDRADVERMLAAAGLELVRWLPDRAGWFALSLSRAV